VHAEALHEAAQLEGGAGRTTALPRAVAGPACLYARAKDRALGEQACRPCKTPHLEVRPVSGRTTASPRGLVLVVLGADRIMRALQQAWAQLELTGAEGRAPRAPLGVLDVPLAGPGTCWRLPNAASPLTALVGGCRPPSAGAPPPAEGSGSPEKTGA
jgi:hypothetical protein